MLEQFKGLLTQLPATAFKYARYCRDLEDCATTIDINAENYENQLSQLPGFPGDDRAFLKDLMTGSHSKFLRQIEADLKYLAPGRELFSQMLSTIRGLVEIEQAERDRQLEETLHSKEEAEKQRTEKLQNTIQALGAGVGVAGIMASSYQFIKEPWQWPPSLSLPPHPFVGSVGLSFVFGFLTWRITKTLLNKATEKQQLPSQKQQSLPSQNQQSLPPN